MTASLTTMPLPARRSATNRGNVKYDLGALEAGSDKCILLDEVVDVKKAVSRLTSAVAAYRKRNNSNAQFTVRSFKNDQDQDMVGVWRLADKVPAEAATEAAE